jgi:arylsulfatase A-like enzyme
MLKSAGYRTALFGKWHLGTIPECEPNGQGFDEFFGFRAGCIDNYSHYFYWAGPHFHDLRRNGREVSEDGTHFSDLVVREARRFIGSNRDRPFFLYLPFNLPHYPAQAAERFRRLYASLPEPRRSYAASVSSLDHSVGEILAEVDRRGLRERTLVIFLSDHGHSTEERGGFGGGYAGRYRGAKFSLLEGGIRVPCLVSLPGTLPQGVVRDQLGVSFDWLPTIAELTGAPLPGRTLEGRSLVPVLRSGTANSPHAIVHWQQGNQWAVRRGDWKLIVNGVDTADVSRKAAPLPAVFLVNFAEDQGESRNRAAERPDLVDSLTRAHTEWANGIAAERRGAQ